MYSCIFSSTSIIRPVEMIGSASFILVAGNGFTMCEGIEYERGWLEPVASADPRGLLVHLREAT
jgi:hypothetical protein